MKHAKTPVVALVLLAGAAFAAAPFPDKDPATTAIQVRDVQPPQGKAGDVLKASGDSLNAERVREVYLADDTMEYRAEVLEQTERWFTFRIPSTIPAGRYRVAVIATDSPALLEEPVFVKVIDAKGP